MPIGGIAALVGIDAATYASMGKWSIDNPTEGPEFSSTATDKATGRIAANKDWSGSVEAYGHTPIVKPGQAFTFHGSFDGTDGVTGNAICSSVTITINQETGEAIKHTVNFEGNGLLVYGTEAGVADSSVQNPFSPLELPVKITPQEEDTPAEVTLDDVRSVTLTINRTLHPYSSSSTAKAKKRVAGRWDAEATVSLYANDPADFPATGKKFLVKLYATASTFWELSYGLLLDITGVEVDRETGAVIGYTLKFGFSAVCNVGAAPGTPTKGRIHAPGAVAWWP